MSVDFGSEEGSPRKKNMGSGLKRNFCSKIDNWMKYG